MTLLEKLKSLFGMGGDGSTRPGGNDGVTNDGVTVESDATRSTGREAPPPMSGREPEDATDDSSDDAVDDSTGISIEEPTDDSSDAAAASGSEAIDSEGDEDEEMPVEEAEPMEDGDEDGAMPIEEAEPAEDAAAEDGAAAGSDASGSTETISRVPDEDDGAAEQGEAVGPDETDAAPTAEKATEDEPEPEEIESEPVTEIKGIGSAYGERLAAAGVDSTLALAESDAEELAAETDISASRIQDWIDRANDR